MAVQRYFGAQGLPTAPSDNVIREPKEPCISVVEKLAFAQFY